MSRGLALHDDLDLAEVVAHERRAAADNVEDTISQTDAWTDLNRTGNHMYFGLDAMLVEELLQDGRVGGCNLFAVEPLHTFIVDLLGDSQRKAALGEPQT